MSPAPSKAPEATSAVGCTVTTAAAAKDHTNDAVPTVRQFLKETFDLLQQDSADSSQDGIAETDGSQGQATITFQHNGIQQVIGDEDKDGLSKWGSTQFSLLVPSVPSFKGDIIAEVWTNMPNECTIWSYEISQKGCCSSTISQSVLGLLEGILNIEADKNNETLSKKVDEKSFGELIGGSWKCEDRKTGKDHTVAYKVKPSFSATAPGEDTEA